MRIPVFCALLFFSVKSFGQRPAPISIEASKKWADSVYKTLSKEERIAQLMIVRLSSIDLKTMKVTWYDELVTALVKKYNIGGICLFQGSPVKQASVINSLQATAKTPLMMCMDAEWGVGMRIIDSVLPLPKQMMLGAMKDSNIMYKYGEVVAAQCRRLGLHVNYAPVVDINNNPNNPVINDRSFGENKYKVAAFGIQYMKGMQDNGVMATAKHFPGHGDVAVDSHFDLPVIYKSLAQLDSLELYPFRRIFNAGVGSAMIAHLYIPAIDNSPNRATSLSKLNVTNLLRNKLGYQGLTFTDALEMQGVQKFFPGGAASVESLIAGNDMLCLPGDVPATIAKIMEAIKKKKLSWKDIEQHCRKVLMAKYQYGMSTAEPISLDNLTADLNRDVPAMRRLVAENAITLLQKQDASFFPLSGNDLEDKIAYVGMGLKSENAFAARMRSDYNAAVFYFDLNTNDSIKNSTRLDSIIQNYKKIVVGVHNMSRTPAANFGLGRQVVDIINALQQRAVTITFVFGNAYAAKNFCNAKNLVVCYEDDDIIQNTALDMLQGKLPYKGTLPVTVCENFKYGYGLTAAAGTTDPLMGSNAWRLEKIDSIVDDAIVNKAAPGCVVLVAKNGKIVYQKAFGNYTYGDAEPVTNQSVYDLASVTKIAATTISIMRLYDEGKIDLKKKLGDYLPMVRGSNKEGLQIENLLLHQAGLVAYIPFFRETIDEAGVPLYSLYRTVAKDSFTIPVANNLFMRNDWKDTLYQRILSSKLGTTGKYVYSDNDFIYLGKIVEAVSGQSLDAYVLDNFYRPMGLSFIGFKPLDRLSAKSVVPTEDEKKFRRQLLRGTVHDPGAAMFGGVAGHAGLFSNARDLACIMQMLLNGGMFKGVRYLQPQTVKLFTSYHADSSRRGYGFDKPEKDNAVRKAPYPALSVPPETFGHTGFTGTCTWADPVNNLVYVFLGNRVNAPDIDLFLKMNVRGKIQEAVYAAMRN
jgi:beta-glucosidase-like glycosyl hydrolase/CubicO group peptidase (beta-lactamase class C family)